MRQMSVGEIFEDVCTGGCEERRVKGRIRCKEVSDCVI